MRPRPQAEVTITAPGPLGASVMTSWPGNCVDGFVACLELSIAKEVQSEESVSNFVAGSSPAVMREVSRVATAISAEVKSTNPLGFGHRVRAADDLAGIGLGYIKGE